MLWTKKGRAGKGDIGSANKDGGERHFKWGSKDVPHREGEL